MRAAFVAWCCVVVLAACSDGRSEPAASTSAPATTVAATTAATTTTGAGAVVPFEGSPCRLVSAADVAAAVGQAVEPGRDEPPLNCRFDLGDHPSVHVAVIIEDGQGRLGGAAAIFDGYSDLLASGEAEEVPGLGDAALYAPGFRGLAVDAGQGRFVVFAIGGSYEAMQEPKGALVALAAVALTHL